ncbi:MAG TPA: hypothetical protein VNO31_11045 [Umezawaea sp.]|nr:hypothetical protein [Umezawaea sp.]
MTLIDVATGTRRGGTSFPRGWAAGSAASAAADVVAAVRDDPAARLALASRFYDGAEGIRPYRRAELAFMRWQIRRGVLDPPTASAGGSPWWRAVNGDLLRDTAEAQLRLRGDDRSTPSARVGRWMRFLRVPSPRTWYRAHNSSIVAGYLAHRDLADLENAAERFFMNVALLRVLYADCLVSRPRLALGRFAPVGRLLGDPRRRATDVFLALRNILPARYPLDDVALVDLIEAENHLGHLLDYGVILPRARQLYEHAASDLGQPALLDLIHGDHPAYAWSRDDDQVWSSRRARRTRRALGTWTSTPQS